MRRKLKEKAVTSPINGGPPFKGHIKSLFRERDRVAMLDFFDLWSFGDVKANADAILGAVRGGLHAERRAVVDREGRSPRTLGGQWHAAIER
jgi:hypothetical protein